MQSRIILPQKSNEEYNLLVDEIKSTITESVFNSRQELIKGHWTIGKLIREFSGGEVTNLLQDLAGDVGISERLLWYSLKCYDTYPDLNNLPEGKNISWNKLITKYLSEPKERKEIHKCPICGGDLEASCHTDGNGKP